MFKNMGGNIPGGDFPGEIPQGGIWNLMGGNFPGEDSPGGNLMGGNFPGGSFPGGNFPDTICSDDLNISPIRTFDKPDCQ